MRFILHSSFFILTFSFFLLSSGCAFLTGVDADGYPVAKEFIVDISNLDWMEVSYFPRKGDPVFKMPCRLSFHGSGEVEFRTGRSPQVTDALSAKVDSPYWNEFYTDRRHIGQERMRAFYQDMVDAGLFPKRDVKAAFKRMGDEDDAYVRIIANIRYDKTRRLTDDPRILRVLQPYLHSFREAAREAAMAAEQSP